MGELRNMKFEISLTNQTEETVELQFPSGQQFEIIVRDRKGNIVYQYSEGKVFTQAIVIKEIKPRETITWTDEWDMKVNGELVKPGEYFVTAQLQIMSLNGEGVDSQQFLIEKKVVI